MRRRRYLVGISGLAAFTMRIRNLISFGDIRHPPASRSQCAISVKVIWILGPGVPLVGGHRKQTLQTQGLPMGFKTIQKIPSC